MPPSTTLPRLSVNAEGRSRTIEKPHPRLRVSSCA